MCGAVRGAEAQAFGPAAERPSLRLCVLCISSASGSELIFSRRFAALSGPDTHTRVDSIPARLTASRCFFSCFPGGLKVYKTSKSGASRHHHVHEWSMLHGAWRPRHAGRRGAVWGKLTSKLSTLSNETDTTLRNREEAPRPTVGRLAINSTTARAAPTGTWRLLGVKARLAHGPDLEADLSRGRVVDDVAAVEDKGGLLRGVRV